MRVAGAHKLIQDVGKGFDQHRESVDGQRGWMSPEGMAAAVDSYGSRPEVQQQLDRAVDMVTAVRDEAQATVDSVRAALIPQRDMAGELRAQRDWARQQRLLDSAGNESRRVAMAQEMVRETTDPAQFATLIEEVQPYLASYGLPTGWLDGEIAQRVPALREAKRDLAQADKALTVTRFNVDQQRRALARGARAQHLVKPDK
jgi:hypothetical protein